MRAVADADFPLETKGTVVFGLTDPAPLLVMPTVEAATTVARLLNIGYHACELVAGEVGFEYMGQELYNLIAAPPNPQLNLPIEESPGWTLDRSAKRS